MSGGPLRAGAGLAFLGPGPGDLEFGDGDDLLEVFLGQALGEPEQLVGGGAVQVDRFDDLCGVVRGGVGRVFGNEAFDGEAEGFTELSSRLNRRITPLT